EVLRTLAGHHGDAGRVGYDPLVIPGATAREYTEALSDGGARLQPVAPNLVDALWQQRPEPPSSLLEPCAPPWTDRSVADKLAALRRDLAVRNADATAVVKLDQIAWLCNLRSFDDIPYNPVFEAYLLVEAERTRLFLHGAGGRLPEGWEGWAAGVEAQPYAAFLPALGELGPAAVLVDPARATAGVVEALEANPATRVIRGPSPLETAKAVKSAAELEGMANASLLASVAKVRALLWLRARLAAGESVTEQSFAAELERRYAAVPGYRQLSFETIAATGEHGAIVHYGGADTTPLRAGELFLVDSGVQVEGGTTDDTRTVAVGTPGAEQRRIYTLVLKGHIAAARQRFPAGTPGAALDALARAPLWDDQLQYGHGTGHGVGAFLNVHEGPFALAEARRPGAPGHGLQAGMVTSIEPGYYRSGFGGVRLESLYRVVDRGDDADGSRWLAFEPLTWIPFEPGLVDDALLDPRERQWLEGYQNECLERLRPHLSERQAAGLRAWLAPA
ncbi:MAG TPA: M24 family metallopeptidase, partial [Deferrisomatales bacterium]|nr:M24 family metallopeptidase [Deferrisomatales bacterium]